LKSHGHAPAPKSPKNESFKRILERFQPPKSVDVSIGPGYLLSRGKNEIVAKIKTAEEVLKAEAPNQPTMYERRNSPHKEHQIDWSLIAELKQKIEDLTALIEEEKFQHKIEIKKLNERHSNEITKLQNEHEEHVRAIELDHEDDLKEVEERHTTIITVMENKTTQERNELSKKLAAAEAALDAFKENLTAELQSKWREHQLELELEHKKKAEGLLTKQRAELLSEKNKALSAMSREHGKHVSKLVDTNRQEVDALYRKFTAAYEEARHLKEVLEDFQDVKAENEQNKRELIQFRSLNRSQQNQIHDLKIKLNMLRDHFAEKVSEVDDKYAHKIDNLIMDNSRVRQQYLKKCNELYNIRSEMDAQNVDLLNSAKDALQKVILTRARADVSLTALRDDPADDNNLSHEELERNGRNGSPDKEEGARRPSSAPSTTKETKDAVRETSKGIRHAYQKYDKRPVSSSCTPIAVTSYEKTTTEPLKYFVEEQGISTPVPNTL